jgi:hypothetical protein
MFNMFKMFKRALRKPMFKYDFVAKGYFDSNINCYVITHLGTGNQVAVLNLESFESKGEAEAYARFITDSLNDLSDGQLGDFAAK